ncbi:MAG: hypothetical protein HQ541_02425 [Mariniphaga sp.]|nr:hypothetical protein [Mariniphaga sp.]
MSQKIYEKYYFVLPVIVFLIIKIPHLSLQFFWDEAWSYYPAVYKMFESGPGLLPGALPLNVAKGHPLFFFFLNSSWMLLVSDNLILIKLLPLVVSTSLLIYSYYFLKKHFTLFAANIGITILSVQSLILAQATLVLPEMLVTLFLIICLDAFFSKKFLLFAISGTLMVLTKETSIVFVSMFIMFYFFKWLFNSKKGNYKFSKLIFLVIPLVMYSGYLILHYFEFESYFYKDHLGHIDIDTYVIKKKINTALHLIFTSFGRTLLSIGAIISIIFLVVKKKKIAGGNILLIILICFISFILFSSVNFFTKRYMLNLLTLFVISFSILISQIKTKYILINYIILIILAAFPLYESLTSKSNSDSDLGYVEAVKVHRNLVNYCEEQQWYDIPISASFNMIFYLRDKKLQYLKGDKAFSKISDIKKLDDAGIIVFESTMHLPPAVTDSVRKNCTLIKSFKNKHAWGEIYRNESFK